MYCVYMILGVPLISASLYTTLPHSASCLLATRLRRVVAVILCHIEYRPSSMRRSVHRMWPNHSG